MEQFWLKLCSDLNVPERVSSSWWDTISERYSRTERSYHNINSMFVNHKLPHLIEAKDSVMAMASIFQYLEYNSKTQLSLENCALFREFAAAAGLDVNQVSSWLDESSHRAFEHNKKNPSLQRASVAKVLQLLGAQHDEGEDVLSEDDRNYFQDLDLAVLGWVVHIC